MKSIFTKAFALLIVAGSVAPMCATTSKSLKVQMMDRLNGFKSSTSSLMQRASSSMRGFGSGAYTYATDNRVVNFVGGKASALKTHVANVKFDGLKNFYNNRVVVPAQKVGSYVVTSRPVTFVAAQKAQAVKVAGNFPRVIRYGRFGGVVGLVSAAGFGAYEVNRRHQAHKIALAKKAQAEKTYFARFTNLFRSSAK